MHFGNLTDTSMALRSSGRTDHEMQQIQMETTGIGIGVFGAGYWGPNHVRAIEQLPGGRVACVCDQDTRKLDKISALYPHVTTHSSVEQALADPSVRGVVIALPVSQHFAVAMQALEAGKHVLVEKPLASSSGECLELMEKADSAGLVLMVGHIFLYNMALRRIKDYIVAGDLGTLFNICSQRLNLGMIRRDVDSLWNLAPHDISMISYLLDGRSPKYVSARGFCHLGNAKMSDFSYLTLEYEEEMMAHVMCSWLHPEKVRKMTIAGSRKMIVYDDVSVDAKVQIYDKGVDNWDEYSDYGEFALKVRSGDLLVPRVDMAEPLKLELQDFIDAIEKGTNPVASGASGLQTVRILELATESMHDGGRRIAFE